MLKDYKIVNSLNYGAAMGELEKADIVAYDTETTGLNVRKVKVIGFSWSCTEGSGWYLPTYVWNKEKQELDGQPWALAVAPQFLSKLAEKRLIMHNASFDVRVTANFFKVNLIAALHADTQLMKHTLHEEGPFALKENAIIYAAEIGLDSQDAANQEQLELEQNVKANGGSWTKENKQMFKADLDILAKYAIADTDITLRLFNYFEEELKYQNLHDFFYVDEVMPLYKLVTIKMEHRGVHLDMPKLEQYLADIKVELEHTERSVVEAIMETPEAKEFVDTLLNEDYPLSGGKMKQAICESLKLPLPKLASGKYQLNKKSLEPIEKSLPVIHSILAGTFKGGPVTGFNFRAMQMELLLADQKYPINLASKDQLGKIVFGLMGIEPLSKTKTGKGQFNEDFVEHLAEKGFAWAKELRVFNKMNKIKSSYFDRFMEQQEDGIFYPTFQQHKTTSGRYSGDLQQLSRPLEEGAEDSRIIYYTNVLRALVLPKPGYIYIDDDYSSLEPCVFADDAGDQPLRDIFINGEDFYSKVAIMAKDVKGASADKKAPNFLKNTHPQLRQDAKGYSLGIRYGAKAGKVAQLLNISKEEAQEIIDNYFKAFPLLKQAMDKYLHEAKTKGTVTSKFGRVRHLPEVKELYMRHKDALLDYKALGRIAYKERITMDEAKKLRSKYNGLLNNALNFPIQSAATSIISRACIAMAREFLEKGLDAWVSAIIHDQAIVSVREDQKEQVAEIVQRCMEKTNLISVPLVAIPQFAYNMRDGH
jgi:DNA polymerase I-like protein with 3'-5' exonuclease and polymerase domains